MAQWATFAGVTIVVLCLLLVLTHLSERAVSPGDGGATDLSDAAESHPPKPVEWDETQHPPSAPDRSPPASTDSTSPSEYSGQTPDSPSQHTDSPPESSDSSREQPLPQTASSSPADLSTAELLANVALSQGLFAVVLIGAAIYADIPAEAFGIEVSSAYVVSGLLLGTAIGIALYLANEIGAAGATWLGFDHDETLREMLAPESRAGWLVLLIVVLPLIAFFEELLFRAALIGVLSAGFDLSPFVLAVVSSIAFGLGHGIQGSVGVLVTAALGFVLALVFIATGSLLVVVVAHYLINAFEFVVHEGLGLEWASVLESYN
ncbi:CPBP family intramembrane metalloprotease [Halobacteria archaeon AArc-dxtr1]|nr:CPBP family intramembrane metalloprotease [Halobacteria archaeon AArc-dxtr1]